MAKIDGVKKRKPPTFQHLPEIRGMYVRCSYFLCEPSTFIDLLLFSIAKKLKRAWVEAQKIKSQWKAQKRREGLIAGSKKPAMMDSGANIDERLESQVEDSDKAVSIAQSSPGVDNVEQDENENSDESDAEAEIIEPTTPSVRKAAQISKSGVKRQPPSNSGIDDRTKAARQDDPSRIALPFSSGGPKTSYRMHQKQDAEFKKGANMRGRGSLRGGPRTGRGRGQPNMGMRMSAMLEKIKRDFA